MGHQTNNTKKMGKIHWTQILKLPTHGKKFQKMNSGKSQFKSLQIHAGAAVNPRDEVMNPKKVRALDANPLSQGAKHQRQGNSTPMRKQLGALILALVCLLQGTLA